MALTNMKVFNYFIKRATIEMVAQEVNKFNAASNGAITLSTEGFGGDFFQESMFQSLHASQRRVDRYAANGAQASTALAEIENNIVKVAGGFGPVVWEPSQLTWLEQNEELAVTAISTNLSEAIMQDMLNTAIASTVAALENVAALTSDVSATAGLSYAALNTTHAKFGDRSGMLIAQIMNGTAYHKLIGENISSSNTVYRSDAGGVIVVEILGKSVIVTDAPSLYVAGTPNKLKVLTLVSGGSYITNASDLVTSIETTNGKERIETTFQSDYSFGVGVKGFSWDTVNGGKSPTDAELATGTNWDQYVTSVKDCAGVLTVVDADQ